MEPIEIAVRDSVRRGCSVAAMCIASVVHALAFVPIPALKAGGLLSLLVTFALLVTTRQAPLGGAGDAGAWSKRDMRVAAVARHRALNQGALQFAVTAAVCLSVALAGEAHLWLYPPL
jgi:hypothetical protein